MINSVSIFQNKINNNPQLNAQRLNILKEDTNTTDSFETTSNTSFKSRTIEGSTKLLKTNKFKALLGAVAGFLGIKLANKPELDTRTTSEKLENYNQKYPELMSLLNEIYTINGPIRDYEKPIYTDEAKLKIVETFEKDPEIAYDLSKKLRYDTSAKLDDEIIDTLINDYDRVEKYRGLNHYDTVLKINILKENPLVEKIASFKTTDDKGLSSEDLAIYSEYCVDEESVEALTKVIQYQKNEIPSWNQLLPAENIKIADICKAHPEIPDDLFVLISKTGITNSTKDAIEKYYDSSDKLVKYVKRYGLKNVSELIEYFDKQPDHFDLAYTMNSEPNEIINFMKKSVMTEELFNDIEAVNPQMKDISNMRVLLSMPTQFCKNPKFSNLINFIKEMNIDKKVLYTRMIEDLRCNSIEEMQEILPLYEKYAGTEITNEMVERYLDPMRRAMGLY